MVIAVSRLCCTNFFDKHRVLDRRNVSELGIWSWWSFLYNKCHFILSAAATLDLVLSPSFSCLLIPNFFLVLSSFLWVELTRFLRTWSSLCSLIVILLHLGQSELPSHWPSCRLHVPPQNLLRLEATVWPCASYLCGLLDFARERLNQFCCHLAGLQTHLSSSGIIPFECIQLLMDNSTDNGLDPNKICNNCF